MLVDAVFPAASEVVMVYAGAACRGRLRGSGGRLLREDDRRGVPAYVAMALAGRSGTRSARSGLGDRALRRPPYVERHGRWLHLDMEKLDRAERWFERWEDSAVFLGRLTPVVRSFVSIPAGVFEVPFVRYTLLTLAGSAIWCFAFAGVGYAVGDNWGGLPSRLPVRRVPRRRGDRTDRRLARRPIRQAEATATGLRSRRPLRQGSPRLNSPRDGADPPRST